MKNIYYINQLTKDEKIRKYLGSGIDTVKKIDEVLLNGFGAEVEVSVKPNAVEYSKSDGSLRAFESYGQSGEVVEFNLEGHGNNSMGGKSYFSLMVKPSAVLNGKVLGTKSYSIEKDKKENCVTTTDTSVWCMGSEVYRARMQEFLFPEQDAKYVSDIFFRGEREIISRSFTKPLGESVKNSITDMRLALTIFGDEQRVYLDSNGEVAFNQQTMRQNFDSLHFQKFVEPYHLPSDELLQDVNNVSSLEVALEQ